MSIEEISCFSPKQVSFLALSSISVNVLFRGQDTINQPEGGKIVHFNSLAILSVLEENTPPHEDTG